MYYDCRMIVEVTQYMRPNGRKQIMRIEIQDSFGAPYSAIRMRGWRLAAEVLAHTGEVSITVEDGEQDFACEIVPNGPEVPRAIERALAVAICARPEE